MIKLKIFSSLLVLLLLVSISAAEAVNVQKSALPDEVAKAKNSLHQTVVIGNKDTKRYHLPGMPYYNKVKKYHRVYFESEQQAIDNGYYKAGTGKDLVGRTLPPKEKTIKNQIGSTDKDVHRETVEAPPSYAENIDILINYKLIFAFILFIIVFALPFSPAIVEIIRKQDNYPLFISMEYKKDPRYFFNSFKKIINKAVTGLTDKNQVREVMLSKKENVQITESLRIPAATQVEHLLYVKGDMISDVGVHFKKEIYVSGNAYIGSDNVLRALAVEGNTKIAVGTTFKRWLDTQGNLEVGSNCFLGISATCGGKLCLAEDCSFRRLYGMPIITRNMSDVTEAENPAALSAYLSAEQELSFIRKTDRVIAQESVLKGNFLFLKDLRVGRNSVVNGSVKCYGDMELEENVTVYGNIFADGKITVGKGAIIGGHVFSQESILISEHSVISKPDVIKSVLGKKSVRLAPYVTIYGYISTEGKGRVI